MTPVYSGGLVYEYTVEGDAKQQKYGLVDVSGGNADQQPDFYTLQSAFKSTEMPTGDGGFKSTGSASECPTESKSWLVSNNSLPAMPPKASQYFQSGAGKGAGLEGEGSQDRGAESTGTATAGSGQPTVTGTANAGGANPTSSQGAAPSMNVPELSVAPFLCGLVVLVSSFFGATLL